MDKIQSTDGLYEVLDPRLGRESHDDMILLLRVAVLCLSRHPRSRPSMREVVQLLVEAEPKSCGEKLNRIRSISGSIWPTMKFKNANLADQVRSETTTTDDGDTNKAVVETQNFLGL
jgi:hypothetical protein